MNQKDILLCAYCPRKICEEGVCPIRQPRKVDTDFFTFGLFIIMVPLNPLNAISKQNINNTFRRIFPVQAKTDIAQMFYLINPPFFNGWCRRRRSRRRG